MASTLNWYLALVPEGSGNPARSKKPWTVELSEPLSLRASPTESSVPVTGLPAFPQNRNPETDDTAYLREGRPEDGSIHRATAFTPCIGWARFPKRSVKNTEPWIRAVDAEKICFPGKQIFSASTARIHGSVFFTDRFGNRAQPMQGVNAVARWIDPSSGLPSRRYAVSSVSGFLFCGNAGNPVTGTDDSVGDALSDRGSESSTVQGFFDLAGLPLPSGTSAKYQLSVEAIDTNWDRGVGPYAPNEVAPSGTAQPIVVTVSAGGDVQQDILMLGSAQPVPPRWASDTWSAPAAIPSSGDWVGSLDSYDEISYFLLPAKANRTLSVAVTALDDFGAITNGKVRPV